MNRAQRRAHARATRSEERKRLKHGLVTVHDFPATPGVKVGDKITMRGVKRLRDGSWIHDCAPGDETTLIIGSIKRNAAD